jgi:endoglucanase
MNMKFLAGLMLATSLCGSVAQARQYCSSVTAATCTLAHALGRGINMGNMLEAPREGDWGIRLEPAYINLVAEKFKTVRVPVRWTNHAAPTEDATLDEMFAARVDTALDAMLAKNLYVIVDTHHYNQLFGDALNPNEFAVDPQVLEARLINIWRQLAKRYKGKSKNLIFELLNEPHGTLSSDAWNQLLAKVVTAVREVDATRTLMIGPTYWNHPQDLAKLQLPADANLIVAIHTYEPFEFTHQGISWMPQFPQGPTCCSAAQRQVLANSLDVAAKWSKAHGYPLHMGEFGSVNNGDMQSRENYTRMARDLLEANGIGWTYWEFGSTFGAYDPAKGAWIEPIRRALLD